MDLSVTHATQHDTWWIALAPNWQVTLAQCQSHATAWNAMVPIHAMHAKYNHETCHYMNRVNTSHAILSVLSYTYKHRVPCGLQYGHDILLVIPFEQKGKNHFS